MLLFATSLAPPKGPGCRVQGPGNKAQVSSVVAHMLGVSNTIRVTEFTLHICVPFLASFTDLPGLNGLSSLLYRGRS